MKTVKLLTYTFLFLATSFAIISCGNDATKKEAVEKIDKSGPEYTSAYVCPMHCKGSGSDAAGKCPVCQMDYVANKNANAHDHSHDGHNHDGHDHEGHSH